MGIDENDIWIMWGIDIEKLLPCQLLWYIMLNYSEGHFADIDSGWVISEY